MKTNKYIKEIGQCFSSDGFYEVECDVYQLVDVIKKIQREFLENDVKPELRNLFIPESTGRFQMKTAVMMGENEIDQFIYRLKSKYIEGES